MASLGKSRSGKLHYVVLKDKYDVQAARQLGHYVRENDLYNPACEKADVVGSFETREAAAAVQGPINTLAQTLRSANVEE